MKYKVWTKAGAVLKPARHHYMTLGVLLFIAALMLAIAVLVRLVMLYQGSIYNGVREPYIQSLSSDSVVIRWQSADVVKSRVTLGPTLDADEISLNAVRATDKHEISIENLKPSTRYYYRLYHNQQQFRGGQDYWFETAPVAASDEPVRLWVIGDPGRAGENIESVRDAMLEWVDENPRQEQSMLNMIISTGDNAYPDGTNKEFQEGLFEVHQQLFKNYVFWPVYGNHDAKGWSFFKVFTLPTQAEAGGLSSGTEQYYSVDYASLHMIFLDTNDAANIPDDEMLAWLKKDLATTKQRWIMVFMHHPPYTRGSHNSDASRDSGNRMFNVRQRILPVIEQAGVDMVISGHSHSYERSYLIDCHYSVSSLLKKSSILQRGPHFIKPENRAPHQGTIYAVVGSSSQAINGRFNHPVMAVSEAVLGSMIIDITENKLNARFINNWAEVTDQFDITKTDIKNEKRLCQ